MINYELIYNISSIQCPVQLDVLQRCRWYLECNNHRWRMWRFSSMHRVNIYHKEYMTPGVILLIITGATVNGKLRTSSIHGIFLMCTGIVIYLVSFSSISQNSSRTMSLRISCTRDYYFVESSLSFDWALNIHGQYQH